MKQSSCNKQWTEQHTIKTQPPKNCIKSVGTQRKIRKKKKQNKKKPTKAENKKKNNKTNFKFKFTVNASPRCKSQSWKRRMRLWMWMGKISQFRLLFRGAIYNELHEYEVCCDLFAVMLISLSFTVKRSKFSLATSSSSSLSKSSINVEANKNLPTRVAVNSSREFLVGTLVWSSLV